MKNKNITIRISVCFWFQHFYFSTKSKLRHSIAAAAMDLLDDEPDTFPAASEASSGSRGQKRKFHIVASLEACNVLGCLTR